MLPNIVFGQYKSLVRSAPWERHHATVILKEIGTILRVRILRGLASSWIELILIQKNGVPDFGESEIDAKLQIIWDTFTWDIIDVSPSIPPRWTVS